MDDRFVLRRAHISDIDALSQLCQRTIRETFVEDLSIHYPEKYLDSYFRSSTSPEWFANKIVDPQQAVWIIEDTINNEFIAYAVAGASDDISHLDVCPNKDGILNRLYIRRDHQSHGFGRQLMKVILSWLDEHYSARPVWLSVLSKNFKAHKFYAHYGFYEVGEYDYLVGESKDHMFIMKRQTNT
ncbi:unnamed protein product [Rotaria sp. Silwood1]|nr:unnamed protein product [Rotaria sp. Silwood1]CAF1554755.1 unnamed protein product [Rotaria sp. Silwood1]CAF3661196.1 unnamed protein product [Rotaria sp. Silwood1]CAF4793952.1 unnamed protein product [Rotaria sp. Silwood1]CAF4829758.1 unnamed protein product [Rotaria sp. Silwood1]